MALSAATGVLSLTTGAATTVFTVSGLSFQPKALLVWWNGRDDASDAIGAHTLNEVRQGFGFATGATQRFATGYFSERKSARTDCLIATVSNITVSDGRVDFQAFTADGFELVVDDALPAAFKLAWLALGGADLTNVLATSFTQNSGTGSQSVTGIGFQPDAALFIQPNATSTETFSTEMHFGFAAGATPANIAWAAYGSSISYCKSAECLATCESSGTGVIGRAAVTSWDADGFTLNRISDLGASRTAYVLALKGGQYKVGSFSTRTDGADITVSVGFQARAMFAISAGRAESTGGAGTSTGEVSAGAFTSTSSREALNVFHDLVTDSQTAIEYDAFYINIDTTPAILGLADVTAIGASDTTVVMDDADNAANFVGYIAFGDAVAAAGTARPKIDGHLGAVRLVGGALVG